MTPPLSPEDQLLRSWTHNAGAWTAAVRGGQIASRRAGTDRAILEAVEACGAGRVLDVGCGEGWLVRALAAQGREAVGVDGSGPLVEAASEGAGTFLRLTYDEIIADPARLGEPFDAVVCNFSLLGEPLAPLLRALRTRLIPGGFLLIQTVHPFTACGDAPYRDGWRLETFDAFVADFAEPMPWYFRTVASWLDVLHAAGYILEAFREPHAEGHALPLSLLLVGRTAETDS